MQNGCSNVRSAGLSELSLQFTQRLLGALCVSGQDLQGWVLAIRGS